MGMGVSSVGQGGLGTPWIFIHGTNIGERGLKVLFFGFFCYFSVFFQFTQFTQLSRLRSRLTSTYAIK